MRIGFIGDIVGKHGRDIIAWHLKNLREKYKIDIIIANYENASHGFGLTPKNSKELFESGIDVMTGGNHTWDKKDIIPLLEEDNNFVLRPLNYPKTAPGEGLKILNVNGEKLAIINVMGSLFLPMVDNPFVAVNDVVQNLKNRGIKNIFIDFHAEATSEKRAMFELLKGQVSIICGTHTHIGTDDLTIEKNTLYLTDIGATGCRDGILGMDSSDVRRQCLDGIKIKYDIAKECPKILQMLIVDIDEGKAINGFKIKVYDKDKDKITQKINENILSDI